MNPIIFGNNLNFNKESINIVDKYNRIEKKGKVMLHLLCSIRLSVNTYAQLVELSQQKTCPIEHVIKDLLTIYFCNKQKKDLTK